LKVQPGVVAHAYNPSYSRSKDWEVQVQESPYQLIKAGHSGTPVISTMQAVSKGESGSKITWAKT
jgi:hypothetical protein